MDDLKKIIGVTLNYVDIEIGDTIAILSNNNIKFEFIHHEVCCETFKIESIEGDINDLI